MGVYTTKFYQEKGGYISAVAFEDGQVINIIDGFDHFEDNSFACEEALDAARKGWPYSDAYEPKKWNGLNLQEAADKLEETGELIAEIAQRPWNDEFYSSMDFMAKRFFSQGGKRAYYYTTDADVQELASDLYAGGWKASDIEEISDEYKINEAEAKAVAELLEAYEKDEN